MEIFLGNSTGYFNYQMWYVHSFIILALLFLSLTFYHNNCACIHILFYLCMGWGFDLFVDGEREEGKTTFEILDRTAFHLKQGDLLEAAISLNRLQGKE